MKFPEYVSLTITNKCNLKCQMCGQWSENGYMKKKNDFIKNEMNLDDWKKVIDELNKHNIKNLLIRGGEPFLFPWIIELLGYINKKGIFISIDNNGTMLKKYAEDIVRIGNIHLTISVDGPEEIHDNVRGVKGCFKKIKEGVECLNKLKEKSDNKIGISINFTISSYSVNGLGRMPDVARSLSIGSISIVPYYYFPDFIGKKYTHELKENFNCNAFSWQGFRHKDSGVDINVFKKQYDRFLKTLEEIYNFPYLELSKNEYKTWFSDSVSTIKKDKCMNVEKLIDIQPNGDVNFCVDFPDYIIGNVREASIYEIWNNEKAEKFREYRRKKPFSICYRCGAKYMSEMNEKDH